MSKAVLQWTCQKSGQKWPGLGGFWWIPFSRFGKVKKVTNGLFQVVFRTDGLTSSCPDWAPAASWGLGYPRDSYTVWFSHGWNSATAGMVTWLSGDLTDLLGIVHWRWTFRKAFLQVIQKVCVVDRADFAASGVALAWSELQEGSQDVRAPGRDLLYKQLPILVGLSCLDHQPRIY